MPPNKIFSREDILRGAFALAREQGSRSLTARKVANHLHCSTTPIYQHFGTLEYLRLEVAGLARDLLLEYTRRPYSEHVFLNMGIGVVIYAKEQTELYRMLFMESAEFRSLHEELLATLVLDMGRDASLVGVDLTGRRKLLEKMSTFTYGLAALISLGLAWDSSDEYIQGFLRETGAIVVRAAIEQAGAGNTARGPAEDGP